MEKQRNLNKNQFEFDNFKEENERLKKQVIEIQNG